MLFFIIEQSEDNQISIYLKKSAKMDRTFYYKKSTYNEFGGLNFLMFWPKEVRIDARIPY